MRQFTSVTDRQTDTDIVAYARDVYITSRAKNEAQIYYLHSKCFHMVERYKKSPVYPEIFD